MQTITVAALTEKGDRITGSGVASNYGDNIFISAPGLGILATAPDNKLGCYVGTSMAAPHIAGVAALMLERNPSLTIWDVRKIIAKTAKKLEIMQLDQNRNLGLWSKYYGYGLVDAYAAVMETIEWK